MTVLDIKTPKWAVDFLKPSRYKGAWGGRSSGKSHFFAEMLIEEHIMDANTKSVCIREVQKSLNQSVKALIESKIESLGVADHFEIQQACIKNKYGSGLIIFQGMNSQNSDSIKSLEGFDRALIEEAQSMSQVSIDLLRPTIRKPNSELWFVWNPKQANDPVELLLRSENPPKDSIVKRVNHTDNPWMPDVMIKEMEYDRSRDFEKYEHIWNGEYVKNSEKRIYKNWKVEEFDTPKDAMFYFGCDLGFSVDPTVIVRCFIEGKKLYIDYEAREIGCETVEIPNLFLTIPEAEMWPITIDSSRPETISHLRRNGFPKARPSVKGAKSVIEGIEFLRGYDIIVHPRCTSIINDLTFYSYKVDPKTSEITELIDHASSDGCDALRYAIELVRRTAKASAPTSFKPVASVNKW